MTEEEILDLVDENDRVIGRIRRSVCHGNPIYLHRAVHLIVLNPEKEIYLQCRNPDKEVQPGKWDTSVGGHIPSGEEYVDAVFREADEELGLKDFIPCFMYRYITHNDFESEFVGSFVCVYRRELQPNPDEISEGRFWKESEIRDSLGTRIFTPNFEDEFRRFIVWRRKNPRRYRALFALDGKPCKEMYNGAER
ncbi:NUDIX domain-containing protein [Marispirochaeta sp.]|jgi:isopentenyldiphosphate isomerase|uniref:NUDIX hydrolase n=1 Tax=Marispirochaeta sp. TaxID=2038653 RepID=UPI0029C77372|nr:NUDIX domain-containing protein [Marispirochaeta sp.]